MLRSLVAVLAVLVLVVPLAGCVSAKTDDGSVALRFSQFADAAEIANLEERIVSVEKSVVVVREDLTAQIQTAGDAWLKALSEGKTATEAAQAALAAAASNAQVTADAARAAAAKAVEDYDENRIVGRLGIEEILAVLGITGVGGVALNSARNRSRRRALATATGKPTANPGA